MYIKTSYMYKPKLTSIPSLLKLIINFNKKFVVYISGSRTRTINTEQFGSRASTRAINGKT